MENYIKGEYFVGRENHSRYDSWGDYHVSLCIGTDSMGRTQSRVIAKFKYKQDAIIFKNMKNKEKDNV